MTSEQNLIFQKQIQRARHESQAQRVYFLLLAKVEFDLDFK